MISVSGQDISWPDTLGYWKPTSRTTYLVQRSYEVGMFISTYLINAEALALA